jgi:hypothetical protein
MTYARQRSATAPQARRQRRAAAARASMSPKDHAEFRPVPKRRGTMSRRCPDGHTAQTTCRVRPSSTAIEPYSLAPEITHAFRLRQKVHAAGAAELVVNVWGVGLRLSSAPLEERA